ncbi:uncharacterized protein LOC115891507 [Sitophilus oryzae]|uniref:Uncharacterized protein LOC115891507 n=1 Tax=Sitophilus oryzae TaxID=7048 RepID=A0A6J2YYD6_SITOR|nr:uncharacterized protein LOC115891507 [Sitophilus oryzae]
MKSSILIMIILGFGFIQSTIQSPTKPPKRLVRIVSTVKRGDPKHSKRSAGSPFLSNILQPRILSKKPLNVLQNGPYFINHYIYCDNLDKGVLEQIKSGTISSEKAIELLNLNKPNFHDFHGLKPSLESFHGPGYEHGIFTGNKEFHILDLPKEEPHGFVHETSFNTHFSESPSVDLNLNQNFDNFEISLEGITPAPPSHESTSNEVVTPLYQGHIPDLYNHKINTNLDHIVEYLNKNVESIEGTYNGDLDKPQEENLEVPHLEQHPLEHDPSKSSYDTPGAVDSYGHPVTPTTLLQNSNHFPGTNFDQSDHTPFLSNAHQGPYGNPGSNFDLSKDFLGLPPDSDSLIKHFSEINELQRNRRQGVQPEQTDSKSILTKSLARNDVRHPNHKYD